MTARLSRRTMLSLGITAACGAAAFSLIPGKKPLLPVTWQGQIMGATASLTLYDTDTDPDHAKRLIGLCLDEMERLEQIFSLIRPDSEVSRLNRSGSLLVSADMIHVIDRSQQMARLSDGAFDISVQSLWRLYSDHFARLGPDAAGPDQSAVNAALNSLGWRDIHVSGSDVRLGRPSMGLTFNSIARGYATDRIGQLLRDHGMEHVLLDLDNYLALGPKPDGSSWRLGIADPKDPQHLLTTLETKNRAIASSGGYGTQFDRLGLYHHIFDPQTGQSAHRWAAATVVAQSATTADALSTALLVAPKEQAQRILKESGGERAYLIDDRNQITIINS